MVAVSIDSRFTHYKGLAQGDQIAAAVLVLAEVLGGAEAPAVLKVSEVAQQLNVGKATVYDLVDSGKLPALRVGQGRGTIRISQADLAHYQQAANRTARSADRVTMAELRNLASPLGKPPRRCGASRECDRSSY